MLQNLDTYYSDKAILSTDFHCSRNPQGSRWAEGRFTEAKSACAALLPPKPSLTRAIAGIAREEILARDLLEGVGAGRGLKLVFEQMGEKPPNLAV
jgi:hypothetical protein